MPSEYFLLIRRQRRPCLLAMASAWLASTRPWYRHRAEILTDVGVPVVVVDLRLGGVERPDGVRVADALAGQRALVELQSDEREYRQHEHGQYHHVAQPSDGFQ